MSIHPLLGPGEAGQPPVASQPGQSLLSSAIAAIGELFRESPLALDQFQEARNDRAQADLAAAVAEQASRQAAEARARASAERHKASPHRQLGRRFATAAATALALLDVLPAYWTAEAFGLDQIPTLALTVLLCAALGGQMWLLDLFATKGRRVTFWLLVALLGAGFVTIFALRLDYLQVTGYEGMPSAALGALALTGMSAALVAVGFVLLSHRRPKAVASADRAARRAARADTQEAASAARTRAGLSRAALEDTVMAWAISHPPAGIAHEEFLAASSRAIAVLLMG